MAKIAGNFDSTDARAMPWNEGVTVFGDFASEIGRCHFCSLSDCVLGLQQIRDTGAERHEHVDGSAISAVGELIVEARLSGGRARRGRFASALSVEDGSDALEGDRLMSPRLFVDIVEHRALRGDGSGRRSLLLLLRHDVRPIRFVFGAFLVLALALFKRLD